VRRTAAVAMAAVALLAGCASSEDARGTEEGDSAVSTTAPVTATSTTSTTAPTTTTQPPLASYDAYVPATGEVEPEVKALAARFLETLGSYPPGSGGEQAARSRLEANGFDPALAAAGSSMLGGDAAALGVVYPQYGGLTSDRASVMAIVKQTARSAEGAEITSTRTIDVRLDRTGGAWAVTGIAADGSRVAAAVAAPSDAARTLLASERVVLSGSAAADVRAGAVDDRIVQLLLRVAERHSLSVTVFATGHPPEVFGTSSTSNHAKGRAVDIYAVDGVPVAGSRPGGPVSTVLTEAVAAGSTEIGGPWDLDGPGGASFTNALHADHLHLAFDR